jgi:hypothetical protein
MDWDEMIGKRVSFVARYSGGNRRHMLLHGVETAAGDVLRDHMWLPYTKRFKKLALRRGQYIAFAGKVKKYRKHDGTWQWGVQNISEIEVLYEE